MNHSISSLRTTRKAVDTQPVLDLSAWIVPAEPGPSKGRTTRLSEEFSTRVIVPGLGELELVPEEAELTTPFHKPLY